MKKIRANFEITTPMFLGGADSWETAELKATSVKGVLRFWFRAINYAEFKDYRKVKEKEDRLFGSTSSQSMVHLKLDGRGLTMSSGQSEELKKLFNREVSYLGYGLYEGHKDRKYRPYLSPSQNFEVNLLLKPKSIDFADIEDLIKPIQALALFGGLGSRSRRGFGSITLNTLQANDKDFWDKPNSKESLKEAYRRFYSSLDLPEEIPEYTAFSKNNRTIIFNEFENYPRALSEVGRILMQFRSNCKDDAELISEFSRTGKTETHPKRVAFGLPHNYYFPSEVNIDPIVSKQRTRRASPLFIKIFSIKTAEGTKYIPVMTLFPTVFLPKESKIEMKNGGRIQVKHNVSYEIIHQFMEKCMTEFGAVEVTPSV